MSKVYEHHEQEQQDYVDGLRSEIEELQRAKEELLAALVTAELYLPKGIMNPTSDPLTTVRAAIEAHK